MISIKAINLLYFNKIYKLKNVLENFDYPFFKYSFDSDDNYNLFYLRLIKIDLQMTILTKTDYEFIRPPKLNKKIKILKEQANKMENIIIEFDNSIFIKENEKILNNIYYILQNFNIRKIKINSYDLGSPLSVERYFLICSKNKLNFNISDYYKNPITPSKFLKKKVRYSKLTQHNINKLTINDIKKIYNFDDNCKLSSTEIKYLTNILIPQVIYDTIFDIFNNI